MKTDITIIGTGALGTTLARALCRQGPGLKSLYNRTEEDARQLAVELDTPHTGTRPVSRQEIGDLLFLTVPDEALVPTALELSQAIDDWDGVTAVHCSGNETSAVLEPLRQKGAATAAFHPLQTFHSGSDPSIFSGIYVSLEGDKEAVERLTRLSDLLGAQVLTIQPRAKPYLHAAAVVACNYLITLMQAAGEIAELGGIDSREARRALLPLIRTTLENSGSADLAGVLSGPIARGDVSTVARHIEILGSDPELSSLYKALGLKTLELAQDKGSIDGRASAQIQRMLSEQ